MEDKLKIGDVVVLNSGGPDMTIVEIDGDKATCWWQGHFGDVDQHEFPIACLKPAPSKETR